MTPEPITTVGQEARIYALDYARSGLRVLPIKPGEKRPPMRAWQDAATTDPATIDAWWTGLYRDHGVGIATGAGSGIFVLDVDVANGKTGDETLAELEAVYGHLPATATVITASGGAHHYFRLPNGVDIRNSAATRLGAGLDIRGEGGQVVAPPTKIGERGYEWEGGEPGDIADAPQWLVQLLTDEPERPTPPATTSTTADDDSIAGRYNQATSWDQLLTADGWTLNHVTSSGEQRWTRPGKASKDGASATVGYKGRDCLMVFTDGVDGLEQEKAYSRFGYTAAVHHAGDRSAFARHLAQQERDAVWTGTLNPFIPQSPADDEQIGHGWEPVDLAVVLAADYTPPKPTVLLRIDGAGLLYPGRMNAIYGESGSGKSWVAMCACAQILDAGGTVVYVDLEDHAASVVARMIALGVDQRTIIERFTYINPLGAWNRDVSEYLVDHCVQRSVELVVIDSTGEAMALDGAKPNDDDDTARWFRRIPRTLARTGAAVLLLDHMPKSTDANQGFAIGSQRKRAAIDGASYRVEVGVAPAKGVDGHLRLITAKDRGGTYQHGHKAAEVDIVDQDGRTVVTIKPPGTGLPTVLMGRICEYLEAEGVSTSRQITRNVSGKDTAVANALNILVDRGYVERSVRQGKSGGFDHRLVRHFTELDGFDPTPETEPLPALPNRGPAEGQHPQHLTVAPLPRIHTNAGHGPRLDAPEGITKTPRVAPTEGNGWNHPEEPALAPTGTEPTQPVKGPF